MRKTSFSLREEQIDRLDELVDDDDRVDADNRSEAMRQVLDDYWQLRERVQELERDVHHAEARADDLRRSLVALQDREDDVDELARYVEEERSVEQKRREASAVTRAKWWLFGMESTESDT